jgi:hypothetical protein
MNKSESIAALAAALAKAQGQIKVALKDSANPFYKSRYADLTSVWAACREPLSTNGLSVVQIPFDTGNESVGLETILLHESGEFITGQVSAPLMKLDPQGVGSALTYLRRYGLSAMVGIVADDDDDGNAASQPRQPQQPPKTTEAALRGELLKQAEKLAKVAGYSDAKIKIAMGRLAKKTTAEMQQAIEEFKAQIDEKKPQSEEDKAKESTRAAIRGLFEKLGWKQGNIDTYLGDKSLETASLDQLVAWHDELQGDGPAF